MLRAWIRFGIENRILVDLAVVVTAIAGIVAWLSMPKEEFPEVAVPRLVVVTVWPGATARDVEDAVVRPQETALGAVGTLGTIEAESSPGLAVLLVDVARGQDPEAARDDAVRALRSAGRPEGARPPDVQVARLDVPLVRVALLGDPRRDDVARALADELRGIDGVREVETRGAWSREVRVALRPAEAAARGLSPGAVADAIRRSAVGLPAGDVTLDEGRLGVRVRRGARTVAEIGEVRVGPGIRVLDVADVEEAWVAPEVTLRVGGQPAIDLALRRTTGADVLAVVPRVEAWAAARDVPDGLRIALWEDSSRTVRHRLGVLASNGLAGAALVAVVLTLMVGWDAARLALLGLPFAYAGSLVVLWLAGTTVNVVSMFGFVLVTGVLVDDAIVVVENIARRVALGMPLREAAVEGTVEVVPAVLSSSLTTMLAFAPLLLLEGTVGRVLAIVPTVVVLSLAVSLVEAVLLMPPHAVHWGVRLDGGAPSPITVRLAAAWRRALHAITAPSGRAPTLLALACVLALSAVVGLRMPRSLTTPGEPVFALVDVDLAPDADAAATEAALRHLERWVVAEAGDRLAWVGSVVGEQQPAQGLPTRGARHGQLRLGFVNDPERLAGVPALLGRLAAEVRGTPGVVATATTTLTGGPPVGRALDVYLLGDAAADHATALATLLAERPGVTSVRLDRGPGPAEIVVDVSPARARAAGVDLPGLEVRDWVAGRGASTVTIAERSTQVTVTGPTPEGAAGLADRRMGVVRLAGVADVHRDRGEARLVRLDGVRAVRVSADVGPGTTADAERARIDAFAGSRGAKVRWVGEIADADASFGELPGLALLGVLLIYATLAMQFGSFAQPLLVLATVPCGVGGAILGLAAVGQDLSLIAAIGIVGLIGIVVNGAIVLVDFANARRAGGLAARDAIVEASMVRLRPLLSTTITTVLGLLPLGLGLGGSDALLAPMAVAVSTGLGVATALTLVALPVLYVVLADLAESRASSRPPR